MQEWKVYLSRMDLLIGEAFKMCLVASLEVMYVALHGDGTTPPSPLILIHVELIDNKVIVRYSFSIIILFKIEIKTGRVKIGGRDCDSFMSR